MNENKLKQLFDAARKDTAPVPPSDFAADVLRAARRELTISTPGPVTVFDQLNRWFPRLALAAAAVIILCIAADYGLTSTGLPELGDGAAQISSQFDLNEDGL
ncbi:MAG TPA: hypothetical protein VG347_02915 [Verrucomicrobiae bacterium]|nr:hypothetical protein [Verrucomicrobiae bacterium]